MAEKSSSSESSSSDPIESDSASMAMPPPAIPSTSRGISHSTRIQRNVAEKLRRDKVNGYINQLANLVPMVSMSSKRLDKTSILRLSAAHLRLCKSPLSGDKKFKCFKWCPSFLNDYQVREILESVDGFLIIAAPNGKILFTSRSVERYLRYQNIDMIGHSMYKFIHPYDVDAVKEEIERLQAESLENGNSRPSPRFSFQCRMKEKGQPRSEVATYQCVQFIGDITVFDEDFCENGSKSTSVISHIFKAFVRIVDPDPYNELAFEDNTPDEYLTRHSLDGTIIFADQRLSIITGHLPVEVTGQSAYKYILLEDIPVALFAHHLMFSNNNGAGLVVYRLRTRDEKFVYLKSVGCIQYNRSTNEVDHFVCVNQLLCENDGKKQLKCFVDRFVPHIEKESASSLFQALRALQLSGLKQGQYINVFKEANGISPFPFPTAQLSKSHNTENVHESQRCTLPSVENGSIAHVQCETSSNIKQEFSSSTSSLTLSSTSANKTHAMPIKYPKVQKVFVPFTNSHNMRTASITENHVDLNCNSAVTRERIASPTSILNVDTELNSVYVTRKKHLSSTSQTSQNIEEETLHASVDQIKQNVKNRVKKRKADAENGYEETYPFLSDDSNYYNDINKPLSSASSVNTNTEFTFIKNKEFSIMKPDSVKYNNNGPVVTEKSVANVSTEQLRMACSPPLQKKQLCIKQNDLLSVSLNSDPRPVENCCVVNAIPDTLRQHCNTEVQSVFPVQENDINDYSSLDDLSLLIDPSLPLLDEALLSVNNWDELFGLDDFSDSCNSNFSIQQDSILETLDTTEQSSETNLTNQSFDIW